MKEGIGLEYPISTNLPQAKRTAQVYAENIIDLFSNKLVDNNTTLIIWCMGSSGDILSTFFYHSVHGIYPMLPIYIINIPKIAEAKHSTTINQLNIAIRNHTIDRPIELINVIIDDHIASGETLQHLIDGFIQAGGKHIDAIIAMNAARVRNINSANGYIRDDINARMKPNANYIPINITDWLITTEYDLKI